MQTTPLRLAIAVALLLLTLSCQTKIAPLPKDAPDLVSKAVNDAKAEICRGQVPKTYTAEQYNSAPPWMQAYIKANDDQWTVACGA